MFAEISCVPVRIPNIRDKIKIAIIQGAFLPVPALRGGAVEKIWYALGREFGNRGHEIVHISRKYGGLENDSIEGNVRYRRVAGFDQPAGMIRQKFYDLFYSLKACRQVPDCAQVVVTNTFWAPLLLRKRKGVYVSVERFPKGQMRLYRMADRLRANSSAIQDAIINEDPSAMGRVVVIPNPLTESNLRPIEWTRKEKLLLYAGRIHPEKGIEPLLSAFLSAKTRGALDGWRLELVGPWESAQGGGGIEWAEQLKRRFHHRDITWFGPIFEPDRLALCYERASIFVYPSLAEKGESFGVAPLEAMAWGAVPLVSALACFRDFITPGQNGFDYDHRAANNVGLLENALGLVKTFDLRPMALEAMKVRETHSLAKIASLFIEDFRSIVR